MEERIAIQLPASDGSVVVQSHEASEDGEDIMRGIGHVTEYAAFASENPK